MICIKLCVNVNTHCAANKLFKDVNEELIWTKKGTIRQYVIHALLLTRHDTQIYNLYPNSTCIQSCQDMVREWEHGSKMIPREWARD
jgi:hypothetical protein